MMCHQAQPQFLHTCGRKRKADQPASVLRHEVNRVRCCHLCGDNEITFILTVLIIHQDEHPAISGIFNNIFNGRKHSYLRSPFTELLTAPALPFKSMFLSWLVMAVLASLIAPVVIALRTCLVACAAVVPLPFLPISVRWICESGTESVFPLSKVALLTPTCPPVMYRSLIMILRSGDFALSFS